VTGELRAAPRLAEHDNSTYLLPTLIRTGSPEHPLADREFLFPFASVVEVSPTALAETISQSLVVTVITADEELIRRLAASPRVDRLNLGPIPTCRLTWDQPHEGNLFEHLYARRAFQRAAVA
jgi:acyl-CoA reductase-like NAD-dependent aldehyde dehydrogenase